MTKKKNEEREVLDAAIPLAIRKLYPDGVPDAHHLAMVTETPPHMIMALVRMRLVTEALNPKRTRSLLEIFLEEFDRRMISKGRRGREEFIEIMQAENRTDEDELEL